MNNPSENIKTALNKEYNKATDGEILLFRKLSSILEKKYSSTFIEEIHQRRIKYTSFAIDREVCRELSDLWIIVYSPNQQKAKMTFLQAKYIKHNISTIPLYFSADYFQFELLKMRIILNESSMNFPKNILSYTNNETIGTYGIFYRDSEDTVEFAYCSAARMNCFSSPLSSSRHNSRMSLPENLEIPNSLFINNEEICLYACDVNSFTKNLIDFKIGAEITENNDIVNFIATYFNSNRFLENNVIKDFKEFLKELKTIKYIDINDTRDNSPFVKGILLVNIDKLNK